MNTVTEFEKVGELSGGTPSDLLSSDGIAPPPIQPDQEWANALTHGIAAKLSVIGGVALVVHAAIHSSTMAWASAAYITAVFATFMSSFLSHFFLKQPWLNTFRAWDQGTIYTMIVGTYTPIAWYYTDGNVRVALIVLMWSAAIFGAVSKIVFQHRLNNMSPIPYIALGWLPAAILYFYTPSWVILMMAAGGVTYSAGVYFLMNDTRRRYYHALWHLFVMTAAAMHYAGIWLMIGP